MLILGSLIACRAPADAPQGPPNILVFLADDWSYPHAGAYGDAFVATPNFDRIAREGVLFTNAYCAAPSCTPSRGALLTGRYPHSLEEGGTLWSTLPKKFSNYVDLLEQAGYVVGHERKGWGPGHAAAGGYDRNPAGPRFDDFEAFLAARPEDRPFAYLFGSHDPHRDYEIQKDAPCADRSIPAYLPAHPDVACDLRDYFFEVQRFDTEVGQILARLDSLGEGDHTLVVITSDNGMPFPRAKANLYDGGTRVPLAIRWPAGIRAGRQVDAFINLIDLAPTFLEAGGQAVPAAMHGASLLALLQGSADEASRDRVFLGRERHAYVRPGNVGYPGRAVRTHDFLYIRNVRPDRWPAGNPEQVLSVGPFGDVDNSPTKSYILDHRRDPAVQRYFARAFAKRPAEELYDLRRDSDQLVNVAADTAYAGALASLRASLETWMRDTDDPRALHDDDPWDAYPYYRGDGTPVAPDH